MGACWLVPIVSALESACDVCIFSTSASSLRKRVLLASSCACALATFCSAFCTSLRDCSSLSIALASRLACFLRCFFVPLVDERVVSALSIVFAIFFTSLYCLSCYSIALTKRDGPLLQIRVACGFRLK